MYGDNIITPKLYTGKIITQNILRELACHIKGLAYNIINTLQSGEKYSEEHCGCTRIWDKVELQFTYAYMRKHVSPLTGGFIPRPTLSMSLVLGVAKDAPCTQSFVFEARLLRSLHVFVRMVKLKVSTSESGNVHAKNVSIHEWRDGGWSGGCCGVLFTTRHTGMVPLTRQS